MFSLPPSTLVPSTLVAAILGLLVGGLVAWLLAQARIRELATRLDERAKASAEKLALLRDAETKLRDAFGALSAAALQANNQSFLDLARTTLGAFHDAAANGLETREKAIAALVKPIEDGLKRVDDRLGEVEKGRIDAYADLRAHVELMGKSQQQLQTETANLVKALRAPHIRGSWGEIQLRRVVEMAGMMEHCDFAEQASVSTDDGKLRPDLVVNLPGGKTIVVDSKAPLAAYLEAVEAPTEDARIASLEQHAHQVKTHITNLAAKNYWSQFTNAPDFVVMFLPGESFFSAACQYDPTLIAYAVDRQVIPASPTTLITLLRTIQFGWRQERIAENAQEISRLGQELYERVRIFARHLDDCGRSMGKAVEHYNRAVGSLEGRVLVSARRFQQLGAATGDEIDLIAPIELQIRRLPPDVESPPTDDPTTT